MSFNPRYTSNPYIRAAGLADTARWPELERPVSPPLVVQDLPPVPSVNSNSNGASRDDTSAPEAGIWPGATGLKYTQTIIGPSRTGGAGMRVSGRRFSSSKKSPLNQAPATSDDVKAQRHRSDSEPTPVAAGGSPGAPAVQITSGSQDSIPEDGITRGSKRRSLIMQGLSLLSPEPTGTSASSASSSKLRSPLTSGGESSKQSSTAVETRPDPPIGANGYPELQFIPRFARGAEMEARRRQRMRARFPPPEASGSDTTSPPPRSLETPPPRRSISDDIPVMEHDPDATTNAISDDDDEDDVGEASDDDDEDDERMLMDADQGSVDHDDEFDVPDFLNP